MDESDLGLTKVCTKLGPYNLKVDIYRLAVQPMACENGGAQERASARFFCCDAQMGLESLANEMSR